MSDGRLAVKRRRTMRVHGVGVGKGEVVFSHSQEWTLQESVGAPHYRCVKGEGVAFSFNFPNTLSCKKISR